MSDPHGRCFPLLAKAARNGAPDRFQRRNQKSGFLDCEDTFTWRMIFLLGMTVFEGGQVAAQELRSIQWHQSLPISQVH